MMHRENLTGTLYALGAYLCWGLFPLYWRALESVPALEVIAHRVVWCFLLVLLLLVPARQGAAFLAAARSLRRLAWQAVAASLIAANWLVFIWAILNGHVLDSSLGYFINPLMNVLFGLLLLGERLRPAQWAAVAVAAAGVIGLAVARGGPPWIALALAVSFSLYGVMRKLRPIHPLVGLGIETGVLTPAALVYLLVHAGATGGFFGGGPSWQAWLLMGGGVVTATPLILFAAAARRLRLTALGLLQYLVPTIHLILGLTVFHEPMTRADLVAFLCIWAGLAIYSGETWLHARGRAARMTAERA